MWKSILPAVLLALVALPVFGQIRRQPVERPAAPVRTSEWSLEQHAAACMVIANQEEIALAEFARDRAKSSEVKEFAEMLIKDHTKMVSKLRKFTPQNAAFEFQIKTEGKAATATDDKVDRVAEPGRAIPDAKVAVRVAPAGESMHDKMISLHRDAAQECYALTTKELKEHEGAHFDQAFLGCQIGAHIGMLAKLQALDGKVTGDFATLVKEGEKTTADHMDMAKKLMKDTHESKDSAKSDKSEKKDSE